MGANAKTLIKKLNVDYTGTTQIWIYHDENDTWSLSFVTIDKRTKEVQDRFSESPVTKIDEDEIVQIISGSGLGISSISAIYTLSEKILEVLHHPEEYLPQSKAEIPSETGIETKDAGEDLSEVVELESEPEPEVPEIDLDTLRKPEDVSLYIQTMKAAMDHEKPVLVGESEVPYSQGCRAQLYRKGDSDEWWVSFISANKVSLTRRLPLPTVDVDAIAKAINQGIPSISLSAVYDAADKVLKDIHKLETRGTDDTILSQAVMHFTKVIESHEEVEEYEDAKNLAEALLKTFAEMNNAIGVKEFALRIVKYLELHGQEGVDEALDVIDENLEVLFGIPGSAEITQQYINACTAFLDAQGLQERAIALQLELANWLINEDEAFAAAQYVTKVAKYYEKMGLIERLIEVSADFGTRLLEAGTEQEAMALLDDIVKILEERKQYIALVDLLAEVVRAIKSLVEQSSQEEQETIGIKPEYRAYAEKAVVYYQKINQHDKSLDLLSWLFKNMMNEFSYGDALNYVTQILEICESINDSDGYISNALEAADALLNIESKETQATAIDYIISAVQRMKRSVRIIKSLDRYQRQLIEIKDVPNAKRLVDTILEFLGSKADVASFKIAAKVSLGFSTSLFEAEIHDRGLDYLKLSGDYYGRAMATDEFIPIGLEHAQQFLEQKNIQPAVELVNIVVQNYEFSKDYKKATKLLTDFANQFYPDHLDEALEFVRKTVQITAIGFGASEAIKVALEYRNKWKEQIHAAVECTRAALNIIIDYKVGYDEAVKLLLHLIDKILLKAGEYDQVHDWVLVTQKFSKYADNFDKSVELVEKYVYIILDKDSAIADRLMNALLNIVYAEGSVERTADIASDFAIKLRERGDFDLAVKYAEQAANIYFQEPGVDKAVNSLVSMITELHKLPDAILPSEKLMDWIFTVVGQSYSNKEAADWGHWFWSEMIRLEEMILANKYAASTIQSYLASAQPEAALDVALTQTEEMLKYGLFDKVLEFLTSAINILCSTDLSRVKDTSLEYTAKFLIAGDMPSATKLADITLEKLGNEFELVGEFSSHFTDQLLERGLDLRLARKYTDKVRAIHEAKGETPNMLAAAKVCVDFAMKAKDADDLDLAKEYFNEASNYQSRAGDNLGAAETLKTLTDILYESGDYMGSIRYLSRAIMLYEMADVSPDRVITLHRSLFEKQMTARDFDKAEETNTKAVQMCKRAKKPHTAREILLAAVDRFRQSGQLRRAVLIFEDLYALSEELDIFDRPLLGEFKLLVDDLKRSNDVESLEMFKTIISQVTERLAKIEDEKEALAVAEEKKAPPTPPPISGIPEVPEVQESVDIPPMPSIPVPLEPSETLPTGKSKEEEEPKEKKEPKKKKRGRRKRR